jgi:hypothetical protein
LPGPLVFEVLRAQVVEVVEEAVGHQQMEEVVEEEGAEDRLRQILVSGRPDKRNTLFWIMLTLTWRRWRRRRRRWWWWWGCRRWTP